jgi:hypothetical protein
MGNAIVMTNLSTLTASPTRFVPMGECMVASQETVGLATTAKKLFCGIQKGV